MYKRTFKDYINNRKLLYIMFIIALISVSTLTIVYAALNVTLNITGTADIIASSWDVHLDNVKVTSGSVSGTEPTITGGTTATFSTSLTTPGDFYEFTIDVVNDGTIDAMIDGVSKTPTLTETQAKYLNYIIEYQNGESINTKQLVSKESFVRLKVRVEFRKDITASDLPTTSETLNLAFTVNYVQSDGSGSVITNNGIYDPYTVGNEKCYGSECFYVISSTEDTVTMLAKYNLYVGETWDGTNDLIYGEEATGKQNLTMVGDVDGQTVRKGVTGFSSNDKKGEKYTDYSGSIVEEYVNNYSLYLSTLGVMIQEARLITKTELEILGCVESSDSCIDAPSWVYSSSYWTGTQDKSVSGDMALFCVRSNGNFNSLYYFSNRFLGVRPVIVISKDYF